jgi:hypothetical protein
MNMHKPLSILLIIAAIVTIASLANAGQLTPSAPPAPTMKSLDEIYQTLQTMQMQINVLMQKTGARFLDNGNGTVTDIRTGLIWLKNANPCGQKNWADANAYCSSLASGQAGLTDGSVAGQWRLPSKAELEGIGTDPPITWDSGTPPTTWAMPGVPFMSVQNGLFYWSSTANAIYPVYTWCVGMDDGYAYYSARSQIAPVWPVRSGQ